MWAINSSNRFSRGCRIGPDLGRFFSDNYNFRKSPYSSVFRLSFPFTLPLFGSAAILRFLFSTQIQAREKSTHRHAKQKCQNSELATKKRVTRPRGPGRTVRPLGSFIGLFLSVSQGTVGTTSRVPLTDLLNQSPAVELMPPSPNPPILALTTSTAQLSSHVLHTRHIAVDID